MIKGIAQHVTPYENGWVVYEDWNPDTLRFFTTQEEALAHARAKAHLGEAPILIHSAPRKSESQVTLHLMEGEVPI
jgi:hypothetical protein